jgi:signal transduction histidine kinase
VKVNSEKTREGSILNGPYSGENSTHVDDSYKILNVSALEQIHESVIENLKYFSFNGKKITILKAFSLPEAKEIAQNNQDIVLIVIDNNVHLNGSYISFVQFIKEELANKNCLIAFKDNMRIVNEKGEVSDQVPGIEMTEFEYARERLLDIIRMIMWTDEMENKIESDFLLKESGNPVSPKGEELEIRSVSNTREKLYTILAHDLKAPISNIKVLLDFLTNEPGLLDLKTSKELLMNVKESASSIQDLLDNFLFWVRLHRNEISFNPIKVRVAQVLRENVMLLRSIASNKGISLRCEVDEHLNVFADEYMISTVMRNLIYNAVKFTPKKGEIKVRAIEREMSVEIIVTDNGIGMSQSDIDKLFRPDLHYTTSGTDQETGTGLGLMLCKDFVEKNGGQISIVSETGLGSSVGFTIPKWRNISVN